MRFVNPMFLIGLAAALLPVLIHLLTRDRIRKVAFSTLRFFAGSSQRVLRRKRFQEAILLALRMAVCGLLAVAFARPFFARKSDSSAGEAFGRARVIVADVSGSILRSQTAAEGLRPACERALTELSEGTDAAALIAFADTPEVQAGLSRQFGDTKTRLAALSPGQGSTNIAAALKAADELLRNVKARHKDIVLVSDLQRSGWIGAGTAAGTAAGDWKLAADVKLSVHSLAPADGVLPHADLAITDRFCPQSLVMDDTPQRIAVKVANFSAAAMADVPVTLEVRGKVVASQKINLPAGGALVPAEIPVQFAHVFNAAGDNPVVVHVSSESDRTAANTAYFNARVMERIPVVILSGTPSANPETDPAFYLSVALSPKGAPPFAVRTVEAARARAEDVREATVIILAGVARLPDGVGEAVRERVERGGGVLFVPGDVVAETFNNSFAAEPAPISPCRLRKRLDADPVPGEVGGVSLVKIDFEHPALSKFALPHAGDFSLTRFFRWWEVGDHQGAATRVLARFEDGRPALLERPAGRGVSMLLASSTDGRWSNIAGRAIFPPLVHELAKHLSIRVERATAYAVGQALPVAVGCQLKGPDGNTQAAGASKDSADNVAPSPGIYTVIDKDGKQDICYAVNAPASELEAGTVTGDEIAAAIQRSPEEVAAAESASDVGAALAGQDSSKLWWYVAVAVGMLFVAELFVANRTPRH